MNDHTDIVTRLRNGPIPADIDVVQEAARAIEVLSAECKAIRAAMDAHVLVCSDTTGFRLTVKHNDAVCKARRATDAHFTKGLP